jgi:hypothetical protein
MHQFIAAINEGKLTLPNDQIMVLVEKKSKLEAAKKQAEKINAGVKANEEKRNAKEIKETNKKINEASKQKKYGDMNVEEAKKELKAIAGNDEEIKERFYKDLEFGTAGLRGIIGMGTNRMNKYTVTKATQGLANYIIKKGGQEKGVAFVTVYLFILLVPIPIIPLKPAVPNSKSL